MYSYPPTTAAARRSFAVRSALRLLACFNALRRFIVVRRSLTACCICSQWDPMNTSNLVHGVTSSDCARRTTDARHRDGRGATACLGAVPTSCRIQLPNLKARAALQFRLGTITC